MHPQTWIKVNACVDKGVADLVATLNEIPRLRTIESCQGASGNSAWVCFQYGDNWKDLANFVLGNLGTQLAREVGDVVSVSIQITSFGEVQGEISIRAGGMKRVMATLKTLVSPVRSGVFVTGCTHGD